MILIVIWVVFTTYITEHFPNLRFNDIYISPQLAGSFRVKACADFILTFVLNLQEEILKIYLDTPKANESHLRLRPPTFKRFIMRESPNSRPQHTTHYIRYRL